MADDNNIPIRITADGSDAVDAFRSLEDIVQEAAQKIAAAGGDAELFTSLLKEQMKSVQDLTATLTTFVESNVSVSAVWKAASADALKQIAALQGVAAAVVTATAAYGDYTEAKIAEFGAEKRIRTEAEKFEAAATAALAENTKRFETAEAQRIAAIESELQATLKAESQKRAAFESAILAIQAETAAFEKEEAKRIAIIEAELAATLKAEAQKRAAFEASIAAIQAEQEAMAAEAVVSAERQASIDSITAAMQRNVEATYARVAAQQALYEAQIAGVTAEDESTAAVGRSTAARIKGAALYALTRYAIYGVVFGIGALIQKEEDEIQSLERLSAVSGATIGEISQFKGVFDEVGASTSKVDVLYRQLARSMELARDPTSKQAAEFRALGVTIDTSNKSVQKVTDILPQLAAHMRDSTRATQDLALITQLAGRSATDLDAVLRLTPQELQKIIDKTQTLSETREEAVKYANQLKSAETTLKNEMKTLADEAIIGLVKGFTNLQVFILQNQHVVEGLIARFTEFTSVAGIVASTITKVATLQQDPVKAASQAWAQIKQIHALANADIVHDEQESMNKIQALMVGLYDDKYSKPTGKTDTDDPGKNKKSKALDEELNAEIQHAAAVESVRTSFYNEILISQQTSDQAQLQSIENVFARELAIAGERLNIAQLRAQYEKSSVQQELADKLTALATIGAAVRASGGDSQKIDDDIQKAHDKYAEQIKSIDKGLLEAKRSYASETVAIQRRTEDEIAKIATAQEKQDAEAAKKAAAQKLAEQEEEIKNAEQHIKDLAKITQQGVTELYNAGRIGKVRELESIQESYDKEYEALKAELAREKALIEADTQLAGDVRKKKVEQIEKEITAITGEEARQRLKTASEIEKQQLALAKSLTDSMISDFGNATIQIIEGQKSISQAFTQMGAQILNSWIKTLEQVLVKKIENSTAIKAVDLALSKVLIALHLQEKVQKTQQETQETITTQVADNTETASATKKYLAMSAAAKTYYGQLGAYLTQNTTAAVTAAVTESESGIQAYAGEGAAGAYAATAAIPIIGPELAPEAGETAYANIIAYSITAARGAVLPNENTFGFLHPNEMVLPESISKGLQSAIGNGTFGGGGGGHTFNFAPNLSAIDSSGLEGMLNKQFRTFTKYVQRVVRATA